MTQEELLRFTRGKELSEQIRRIKSQIENLKYLSERHYHPWTETGWKLSAIVNDSFEDINLSSEEFWSCIENVIDFKRKKLEQLQQEFNEL